MTERQLPRRLGLPMLVAFAVVALASVACSNIAGPKGWASPVAEGDLLLISHRDELTAWEREDGLLKEQWIFPFADSDIDVDALYGTPAILDGVVYVPGYDGRVYALELESGQPLWAGGFDTKSKVIGGIVAADGAVYFGSDAGMIYALDAGAASGRLRDSWLEPFEVGRGVWSRPALSGGVLYVTALDGSLYAIDSATGTEIWSFPTDAGIASGAVVSGAAGLVYFGGFDSHLRAVDVDRGTEVWSVKADNWFWTRPLLAKGVVYAGSLDGKVYAVNAADGSSVWPEPYDAGEPIRSAPLVFEDQLIVADTNGGVHAINLEDGSAAASPLELESDVFADMLLVAGSESGNGSAGMELLVVTTDGELIRIDPTDLRILGLPQPLD